MVNLKYKEIELLKDKNDYDLPLYIEANDSCSKWIPALFSSISIINNEISTIGYYGTSFGIRYKNLHSIKYNKNPLNAIIYKNDIFNFSEIYMAKTNALWPKYCLFGLDYSEVLFKKQNLNSITVNVIVSLDLIFPKFSNSRMIKISLSSSTKIITKCLAYIYCYIKQEQFALK